MENTPETGRKPARQPAKEGPVNLRPGEYRGRDGQIITREKTKGGNKFEFPDRFKEKGWSYQWVRHIVYGDPSHSNLATSKRNGWKEVPVTALGGYFKDAVPEGVAHIELDGMILMERPEGMTKEAQDESLNEANKIFARASIDKVYDDQARSKLPAGIEPWFQQIRDDRRSAQYERAPDAWAPQHRESQLSVDEIDELSR
jgi:hypothetical protein